MKLLPLLLLLATTAGAQTTYTTTANGCGGKNLGFCMLPATDQNAVHYLITLDTRVTGGGPINRLTISDAANDYPPILQDHGVFSGFVGNPNGTHAPYYGSGSFLSDDGKIKATLDFYAYYIATCSGRGCAGATVGWHYQVLMGSSVITP